ncbi:MAG: DUF1330 domain-containing protein [Reichenbachiella sp.]
MIYLTQVIFVKKGKENIFHEFENLAIPIISDYNGRIIYRIRPTDDTFISAEGEKPYEIHFLSFDSELDFRNFAKDERRKDFLHLKEASISSSLLIQGEKL